MSKFLNKLLSRASDTALRLRDEKSGVAAIEFAFIAPLLITIWLGTMEISQGIEVNKKVGRAASMIGDIVTQTEVISIDDLKDVMKIGAAVLQPYQRDAPEITVTAIRIAKDPADGVVKSKVVWSLRGEENVFSEGDAADSVIEIPANLAIEDTFLIKAEARLLYYPITSWSIRKNDVDAEGNRFAVVPMKETYYLRPRQGYDVTCAGC